jgi:hypothetical protein
MLWSRVQPFQRQFYKAVRDMIAESFKYNHGMVLLVFGDFKLCRNGGIPPKKPYRRSMGASIGAQGGHSIWIPSGPFAKPCNGHLLRNAANAAGHSESPVSALCIERRFRSIAAIGQLIKILRSQPA